MNEQPQAISMDNPLTLREVGIHLNTVIKAIEQNALIEKTHHAENLASNAVIMKKLDDIQLAFPSRHEFESFKKTTEDQFEVLETKKAGTWVEKVLIGAGAVIGVAILGAVLSQILIK